MIRKTIDALNTQELYALRAERDALRMETIKLRDKCAHLQLDAWHKRRAHNELCCEFDALIAENTELMHDANELAATLLDRDEKITMLTDSRNRIIAGSDSRIAARDEEIAVLMAERRFNY